MDGDLITLFGIVLFFAGLAIRWLIEGRGIFHTHDKQ